LTDRVYRIEVSRRAERALLALSPEVSARIEVKIDALAHDPRPRGVKKLAGGEALYRLRVGDYRVIYQVRDRVLVVLVVDVGHRRDVYRG
jgi:mRNA interferase RelE/StbE